MRKKKIVAISYAHDSDEYNNKVELFANQLKAIGLQVTMDKILQEEQTACDFNELSDKLITNADKVIVVLSKKYKNKADCRDGGVGAEYRIIQNEIDNKTKKYIFVTFDKLSKIDPKSIIPSALGNREVLEIPENIGNFNKLFDKIEEHQTANFQNISKQTRFSQQEIVPIKYNSRTEILKEVKKLLYENEIIHKQFGPECCTAIKNPLSESVNDWQTKKNDIIIPNNKKIIKLFEDNISLFSDKEIYAYEKFKVHAEAFEQRQEGKIGAENTPVFPLEFKKMINRKERKQ